MLYDHFIQSTGCAILNVSHSPGLRIEFNGTKPGSIANYSCDVGYNLIGQSSRTCLSNRVWSGIAPTCRGLHFQKLIVQWFNAWLSEYHSCRLSSACN